MVISYYGALNAFLTLYNLLPTPILQFVVLCLMLSAALRILFKVASL